MPRIDREIDICTAVKQLDIVFMAMAECIAGRRILVGLGAFTITRKGRVFDRKASADAVKHALGARRVDTYAGGLGNLGGWPCSAIGRYDCGACAPR
jgi:hypothetical protein